MGRKNAKYPKTVSYTDGLHERLKDARFAAEYLTAAAQDPEPIVYLTALRHVVEARGMATVAKRAKLPRESVDRALSRKGNLRWSTLAAILRATGLKLTIEHRAA